MVVGKKTSTPTSSNNKNQSSTITPASLNKNRLHLMNTRNGKESESRSCVTTSYSNASLGYRRYSPSPNTERRRQAFNNELKAQNKKQKKLLYAEKGDDNDDNNSNNEDEEENGVDDDHEKSEDEEELDNQSHENSVTESVDDSYGKNNESDSKNKENRKIELRSYIGKSCLTQGEKSILISYFRKTFFKKLKFTHSQILKANSKEMMTIFQTIKIDNDETSRSEKYNDIVKLLESCLTSKRNYVVERVRQKIKELMKEGNFFDINLIEKFRCNNIDNLIDKESIRNAWYIFVFKLLPLVNEEWCKVLKDNHIQSKPNIYEYTSLSDEAFIRWVIHCKHAKLLEEEKNGWPEKDADKKGKKGGPHESRINMDIYCKEIKNTKLSFSVLPVRDEVKLKEIQTKWNSIFWEEMVLRNPEKFELRPKKRKESLMNEEDMPGMDDDW